MTGTLTDAALAYYDRGWSIFPLKGKRPLVDWKTYQCERGTRDDVERLFSDPACTGIGLALGGLSGVIRIDADSAGALAELQRLGSLPDTLCFRSPSSPHSFGWLLQHVDGITTEKLWKGKGEHEELRVQSHGAYTVLPPSLHPDTGTPYEWINEAPIARIPRWLLDFYTGRMLLELVKELRPTLKQPDLPEIQQALAHIPADDYDMWVQVGMALRSVSPEYCSIWDTWSQTAADKYKAGECEKKWATFSDTPGGVTGRSILYWAEQFGYRPLNRHEPLTDLGNARVLARMGEGKVLHSSKWGWLHWDGKRWSMEDGLKVVQELQKGAIEHRLNAAVQSLARHLQSDREANGFDKTTAKKSKTITLIRKHEDETRIRGSRTLAESEPQLMCNYREFDREPWLFNCANGTLDLRIGELRDFDQRNRLTQVSPTAYNPAALAPRWEQFLEDVLPDIEVRSFLHQFLGCCLSGDTSPQMMPVFWGSGANGKSTLVEVLLAVLGEDYAMKAKRDLLMAKRQNEHPTSLARLRGKRFVACVESSEDGRLDETLVKEITGGDSIAARRMREDEWEFTPSHKAILASNHKPEIRGTDVGIWRRIRLIEFNVTFPEDHPKRDPLLKEKLVAESQGILAWLVKGCQLWFDNGRRFPMPTAVTQATAAYREEQDKLGQWISEKCVVGEGRRGRVEKLMESYLIWCAANKHHAMNGNAFGRGLSERGYPLEAKGSKYRKDIDLGGAT